MSDGRLTYTSFDAFDGRAGGWQVKQEEGLDAAARERAVDLVATSLDLVDAVSRFPSTAEVAALPRRLVVESGPQGTTLLVHSALAGPDSSGRPGNVFSHVLVLPGLVDRLLADDPLPRPLELWRSTDWLTPWGPDAVRDAVLPPTPAVPRPGPSVHAGAVVAFLLASGDRSLGLGALVDAVDQALAGGPPVVLLVDDQETGVLWLAAAAALCSPSASAALTLSTWERAHALREVRTMPRVSLVPTADAELLEARDLVVLDLERQRPATAAGWPCADGRSTVPTGPWSALVAGLTDLSPDDLADRLTAVDEIARFNPRAARAGHLWPLAVAVAEWHLPGEQAAAELLLGVPLTIVDDPETRRDVERLRSGLLGTTTASAASSLRRLSRDRRADQAALDELRLPWLRSALTDPDFLHAPWPPVDVPWVDERLRPQVTAAVVDALGSASAQLAPVDRAVRVLRCLDLAGLLCGPEDPWPPLPADLGGDVLMAARMLLGGDGAAVLSGAAPLTPATGGLLVPELAAQVARADEPPGTRLPEHLRPVAADLLVHAPAPLPQELALEVQLLLPATAPPLLARASAVALLLRTPAWGAGTTRRERTRAALQRCAGSSAWTLAEVLDLQHELGARPDVDLQDEVRQVLEQCEPGDPAAIALAEAVLQDGDRARELDNLTLSLCVAHRALVPHWYRRGPQSATEVVDLLVRGQVYAADERVPQPVVERLSTHLLVAAVLVASWTHLQSQPPLDFARRQWLREAESELPVLAHALGDPVLDLLEDAWTHDSSIATGLFRATVAATFPRPEHEHGTGVAAILRTELAPSQGLPAGALLGESLLRLCWRDLPDVDDWIDGQVDRLRELPLGTRDRIRAWAHDLVRTPAPQDSTPLPAPSRYQADPRRTSWQ